MPDKQFHPDSLNLVRTLLDTAAEVLGPSGGCPR